MSTHIFMSFYLFPELSSFVCCDSFSVFEQYRPSFFQNCSQLGCSVLRVVLLPPFYLSAINIVVSNTCKVYVIFFVSFKIAQHLLCSSCY
ncbi:hypothetical protein COCSADRAFT_233252 [Bipolaris sorokiniana ND90Pr]|uniref:Uncharacterized protein n=1 Tax=Cochliobolus sativus (strain ND90Pr / ATCC 201652) TaxID=665912 RepID=M2SXU3_COCSN|nr:uncharacterized protein COCSADRAFT_233252 [Bipolaris sorokiniana ND90Pr]EMD61612.1 hypothetical protein COCSADRAFT_233252 [Bipolaris sorokiniana ND90Pr]